MTLNKIKETRGTFIFENTDGIPVKVVPEISFEEERTYNIEIKYQKGEYVQIVINGKDEEGIFKLWDSEKLKVAGKANFNRVYFGVRPSSGDESAESNVQWDAKSKLISLNGGGYKPGLAVLADNMVIEYVK